MIGCRSPLLGDLHRDRLFAAAEQGEVRRAGDQAAGEWSEDEQPELEMASPPANRRAPMERAGFTEVLVTGMLIRWIRVSVRPIASGAKPFGAACR